MTKHATPPVSFGDGLGWGAPFLWICANDECPVFKQGFGAVMQNYGQASSLRAIVEPDTGRHSVTPAFSTDPEHLAEFLKVREKLVKVPPQPNDEDLPIGSDDEEE
ncbi:MAG: hypothetical protein HZB29_04120 [Nitrospinae bacterium]|nr:hypothetical protein [Nitrospinota bacterium]